MNRMDFLALIPTGVFESEASDAGGSFFGDDLQAFDNAGNYFVLKAGIKAFRVFPHDHQIDIRITCGNVRKIAHRAEVGVKIELLSELNVDAGEAAADGRGNRPFERDARALN